MSYSNMLAFIGDLNMADIKDIMEFAAPAVSMIAAVYIAKLENRLMDRFDKRYLIKPENEDDSFVSQRTVDMLVDQDRREHERFDAEFNKVWLEIRGMKQRGRP